MARYTCLKVRQDHVVINNKKTESEGCNQWKKTEFHVL